MIQQSIAQFTRNAQKASSIVDDEKLPDRQRGMWSFLTWSFFLAQAVAAHEAFAMGHGGADAGADGDGTAHGADDAAGMKGLAPGSMLGVSGFDGDAAAAAQFAAAIAAGLVTPQMLAGFQADPALFQAFVDQLTADGSHGAGGFSETASASAAGEPGDGTSPSTGGEDHPGHGTDPGTDHGPGHGTIPDLVDVISGIPPAILDDLGMITDNVFEHIVDPLVDTVSNTLNGTLNTLEHVATSALHAVPDILNDTINLVAAPVDTVLGLLGAPSGTLGKATEPLIQIATQATDGVAETAGKLLNVVGDGGNLVFGAVHSLTAVLSNSGPYNNFDQKFASDTSDTPDTTHDSNGVGEVLASTVDVADDLIKNLFHGSSNDWSHG